MQQFITGGQTLKELEAELFWLLQKTYGEMLQQVLEWHNLIDRNDRI
ncbi:hypothetical protein [Anoxybacillus sp. J5B_2022]|nr:hypothetical protein [Anoxybacillus sp. J5B_2022]MCZ0755548.1 hypothetical protein [Anoxybacillus sp. J5B_2022]